MACLLLQNVGKRLDKQQSSKSKKEEKEEKAINSIEECIEKLEKIKDKLQAASRLRYIIMNLLDLHKNKWPESKSKKEGPKKIDEIRNDIEKEKYETEKDIRRDYYGGYPKYYDNYDNENDYHKYKAIYKKKQNENTFDKLTVVERDENENDSNFDKAEILDKVNDHFIGYLKDKTASFEEFKALNSVDSSELTIKIFEIITNTGNFVNEINKDKNTFLNYLYSFCTEKIYTYSQLVSGINKYMNTKYEIDIEDNPNLGELIKELYMCGLKNKYFNLSDIDLLSNKTESEENSPTTHVGRLRLACQIAFEWNKFGMEKEPLKGFLDNEIEKIFKALDEDDLDKEIVEIVEQVRSIFGSQMTIEEIFKKGKSMNFGADFTNLLPNEKTKNFTIEIGREMIKAFLEDNVKLILIF